MAKKYEYGMNDLLPAGHLIMSAVQHLMMMSLTLSFPIIFTSQFSGDPDFGPSLISFSMIAAGLGSIIQSVGLPFIGSGYLCPNVCGPSYLSLTLQAAWIGGLP